MSDAENKPPLMGPVPVCGNCRFFFRHQVGQPLGMCKAKPPTLAFMGFQKPPLEGQPPIPMTNSFWPMLSDTEWCGTHEARAALSFEPMVIGETTDLLPN